MSDDNTLEILLKSLLRVSDGGEDSPSDLSLKFPFYVFNLQFERPELLFFLRLW